MIWMSWFGILKQSAFAPADEEEARQTQTRQMTQQPPMFSPEGVQYFSTPTDTNEQMETAQFFQQQQADAKRQAANLKRTKQREAARGKDYREQLKEGAKQTVAGLNPFQDRGTGSGLKDLGANLGAGLEQVTTKLPENVGRAMDVATAPVFKPIQTARKVGSTIDRATGGAAGRVTKPVRQAISDTASGAAKLGRGIARDNVVAGKASSKGVPTNRLTGSKMSTDKIVEQLGTGGYAGREVEFAGRKFNPETGMWEKPGKDDVYELTAADKQYNEERRRLENLVRDETITSDEREAYQIQLDELMEQGAGAEPTSQGTKGETYTRAKPSRFFNQLLFGDREPTKQGRAKIKRIQSEREKAKRNKT